ncbi:MAG: hypothetical protein ACFE0S_00345 [Rhodospirillales bacterium]
MTTTPAADLIVDSPLLAVTKAVWRLQDKGYELVMKRDGKDWLVGPPQPDDSRHLVADVYIKSTDCGDGRFHHEVDLLPNSEMQAVIENDHKAAREVYMYLVDPFQDLNVAAQIDRDDIISAITAYHQRRQGTPPA